MPRGGKMRCVVGTGARRRRRARAPASSSAVLESDAAADAGPAAAEPGTEDEDVVTGARAME